MKIPDGWERTTITTPEGELKVFRRGSIVFPMDRITDFYGPEPGAGLIWEWEDYLRRKAELEAKK